MHSTSFLSGGTVGLIQDLDRQILKRTCQQLKLWQPASGVGRFRIAINLSGKHLASHEQIMQLLTIMEEEGVIPHVSSFEFNERELSRQSADSHSLCCMNWRAQGSRSAWMTSAPASLPSTPCFTSRWITSRWTTASPIAC